MLQSKLIPPCSGSPGKIAFIGEAPGMQEDMDGKPFVGSAGRLLWRTLKDPAVGIARSEVHVGNIFWQRPPENNEGYFYSDPKNTFLTQEGFHHLNRTTQWLKSLSPRPNLLVALGAVPLYHLTGERGITKRRGSVYPCTLVEGYKVLASLHPAYVLRMQQEAQEGIGQKKVSAMNTLPLFQFDMQKAVREGETPELVYPEYDFDLFLSTEEIINRVDSKRNARQISVDIETLRGADGEPVLWMIGIAESPEEGFIIPFIKDSRPHFSVDEEVEVWKALGSLFKCPSVKKIFHNHQYDCPILTHLYNMEFRAVEDTMWLFHSSYPSLPKRLDILTSLFTSQPFYKEEGATYNRRVSYVTEAEYCLKDCCSTFEAYNQLTLHAKQLGTWNKPHFSWKPHPKSPEIRSGYLRTRSYFNSLLGLTKKGVRIDLDVKEELKKKMKEDKSLVLARMEEEVGEALTRPDGVCLLNSNPELQRIFYRKRGYPVQTNRKTGKPTTDAVAILRLRLIYPNDPFLADLLEYRRIDALEAYPAMNLSPDGRVHCSWSFTSTWRLASSETPWGVGRNLQNIPKRAGKYLRRMFIPDEGYVMFGADLSQAEARVVAWESNDEEDISAFESGELDIHWEAAKSVLPFLEGLEYNAQTKDNKVIDPVTGGKLTLNEARTLSKVTVHGGNYKGGAKMLQDNLLKAGFPYPLNACKILIQRRLLAKPSLVEWHHNVANKLYSTGELVSAYGRKRIFPGRISQDTIRIGCAFSPQNTVGEILIGAIARLWETNPAIPLMNIHDEIIGQCRPDKVQETQRLVEEALYVPLEINGRELVIPTEFAVGVNYCDLKEI